MTTDSETDELLSHEELTQVLAETTRTTSEEIKRGGEAIEIEPPENAEVVSE